MDFGKLDRINVHAVTSACAHNCKFCMLGDKGKVFDFGRWLKFFQRFDAWNSGRGEDAIRIVGGGFLGPADNYDRDTFIRLNEWHKLRYGRAIEVIFLGGVAMRDDRGILEWLAERQALGVKKIHGSFAGYGANHDRWVRRAGDFDFLLRSFAAAEKLGMGYSFKVYLTKISLHDFDKICSAIDGLGASPEKIHIRQIYFSGYGALLESERIELSDLDVLPQWAISKFLDSFEVHSEKEWSNLIAARTITPSPLELSIQLTGKNIASLEGACFEDIVRSVENRARLDFGELPSYAELMHLYGKHSSTKVYSLFDIKPALIHRYVIDKKPSWDWAAISPHFNINFSRARANSYAGEFGGIEVS